MRIYYVYMLTNKNRRVMYIGVTNDLERRVNEHKYKLVDGFTKKYAVDCLVYYETTPHIEEAIAREKQLKGWTRAKKNQLVENLNPYWRDLSIEYPETVILSGAKDPCY